MLYMQYKPIKIYTLNDHYKMVQWITNNLTHISYIAIANCMVNYCIVGSYACVQYARLNFCKLSVSFSSSTGTIVLSAIIILGCKLINNQICDLFKIACPMQ